MEYVKIFNYSLDGQIIIAGYGKQSKGDEDHSSKRLKFARFDMSFYELAGIRFKSKDAITCPGRSKNKINILKKLN